MTYRTLWLCLLVGCGLDDSEENPATETSVSTSATGTSTSSSGSTTEPTPGACRTFTSAESCPTPCTWKSFTTYADATNSCDPGPDVSLCVFESGDAAAGCGLPAGCDEPWGYIDAGEGVRAMATYCGGTSPEDWTTCGAEDIEGGIPECGCACPGGDGTSTGPATGDSTDGAGTTSAD